MTKQRSPDNPTLSGAPNEADERQRVETSDTLDHTAMSGGISWWGIWSAAALLFGILFRLLNLDSYALGPIEGMFAFQGWSVYKGEGAFGPNGVPDIAPIVQLAEAFLFFIAGATDVTARLAPVATGLGILGLILLLRPVSRHGSVLGMLLVAGLSPSLVWYSRTIDPAVFVGFFSLLLFVAVARAGNAQTETRLLSWSVVGGVAIAGLVGSGPIGISAGIALIVAITVATLTHSVGTHRQPDAVVVGARRLLRTPGSLLLALGATILTLLLVFTRLLSDLDAIIGIVDTFEDWGQMVGTRPTTTPVQFFFWAILLYESVSVVLLIVSFVAPPASSSQHDRPVLRSTTFGIWFGIALVLQSLSSGREPSHFLLVSLPLVLGAGLGLGYVIERIERYRLLSTISVLVPLAIASLFIGVIAIGYAVARSNDPSGAARSAQAEILIILLLVIVPISVLLARESSQPGRATRVGWSALVVLVVLLGLFGVRSASMLAFDRSDEGTEMLAQDTSTRGVIAFVEQTHRLSRDLTVGEPTPADPTARFGLSISVSPEIADPYRWYFRDYPDMNVTTAAGWSDSDIVIAPTSEGMEEAGYIVQSRAQFNRVPPAYEGLGTGEILSYFWSPSKWYDGIRFLLFRDTIAEPPPQQIAFGYTSELSNKINPALGPFNLSDSPGRGSALGQFDMPAGIGNTADGEFLYVVDSANLRVQRFSGEGEFVGVWNGQEDPNLAFAEAFNSGPTGLTVDDGLVYIADTWNHRIVVVDRSGQFVREIGQPGTSADLGDSTDPTQQPGLFFGPRGVAVHNGEIYVTDTGNERVQVFASDGTFLRAFGGYGSEPGKLIEPVGIAIGQDGRVYVADSGNHRLSVFDSSGSAVAQIPIPSWQNQGTLVNYLAFGDEGLLYMTAPDAGVVDVYDPEAGDIVHSTSGPVDQPLEHPIGVAVMPGGELLVTDSNQNDVVRFTPELPESPVNATPIATPQASPESATPEDAALV